VPYVKVRPAARAPVTNAEEQKRLGGNSKVIRQGDNDEKRARSRFVGVLSCMRATVRSTATIGATSRTRCAATGGRSTDSIEGHV